MDPKYPWLAIYWQLYGPGYVHRPSDRPAIPIVIGPNRWQSSTLMLPNYTVPVG